MILIARITRFLFGWQWVALNYAFSIHVRRVRRTPSGKYYIRCYGIMFIDEDGKADGRELTPVTLTREALEAST